MCCGIFACSPWLRGRTIRHKARTTAHQKRPVRHKKGEHNTRTPHDRAHSNNVEAVVSYVYDGPDNNSGVVENIGIPTSTVTGHCAVQYLTLQISCTCFDFWLGCARSIHIPHIPPSATSPHLLPTLSLHTIPGQIMKFFAMISLALACSSVSASTLPRSMSEGRQLRTQKDAPVNHWYDAFILVITVCTKL